MQDNENQPTELDHLRRELLRFVADETARGALDESNPVLGPKLVEAIAARVDGQASASVAKELEAFRAELRKELRELGLDKPFAAPIPQRGSRSQQTDDDRSPPSDRDSEADREQSPAGGLLAGFKRNFLGIATTLLLGSTIGLGLVFYQTNERVAGLQAKVNALCTVKSKVEQQLDRNTPAPTAAPAPQGQGNSTEPPKKSLPETIYSILEYDKSCADQSNQRSQ